MTGKREYTPKQMPKDAYFVTQADLKKMVYNLIFFTTHKLSTMQDRILIEDEDYYEFVMRATFDDEEFCLKFYGSEGSERNFSIDLTPHALVPLRDFINKYLNQACFSDQFDTPEKFMEENEEGEQENP